MITKDLLKKYKEQNPAKFAVKFKNEDLELLPDGQEFFDIPDALAYIAHAKGEKVPGAVEAEVPQVTVEEPEALVVETTEEVVVETPGAKHIVTQEDLDLNPELVSAGVQVGEEIELPGVTTD